MGSGFENLILFGLLSLMLLIGTLLRAKVKLFQEYLVPASIIGGLLGFAIISTGWLKIGEWQITSNSFNWFLFHAFNISYISLLLTRPRAADERLRGQADCPDQRLPHAAAHHFFGNVSLIVAGAGQQQ